MVDSNAERQRKHREKTKHLKAITLHIEPEVHKMLVRLSKHQGKTQAEVVSDLLSQADLRVGQSMRSKAAQYAYFEGCNDEN